ncbi:hypothetical protein Tsubulata_019380 [Turnera subulata]|uniref:Cation/H+ exchanger domain-containing protein n=1 Tax=Turnera subulata TaxID=218843 RepID=A0A9Q0FW44_9ROSI|nr:hypothetical protein Tsubulata_019380 [Turnera subulata]
MDPVEAPVVVEHSNATALLDPDGRVCTFLPPKMISQGMWDKVEHPQLSYSLSIFEMQVVIILFTSKLVHLATKRLGVPLFVSHMIAGLILSPYLLGRDDEFKSLAFPEDSREMLGTAGVYGYMLYVFISAVKVDATMIFNNTTGKKAISIAIASLLAPLSVGVAVFLVIKDSIDRTGAADVDDVIIHKSTLFLLTMSHYSIQFPVIATFLYELKMINSELGRICLSSAVISDLVNHAAKSLLLFSISSSSSSSSDPHDHISTGHTFGTLAAIISLVLAAIYIFRPLMFWAIKRNGEGRPIKRRYISGILIVAYASGLITHELGHFATLGPFIIGLVIPDGRPLGSTLADNLDTIASGLLLPIFATSIFWPLNLNAGELTARAHSNEHRSAAAAEILNILLIVVTLVAKAVGCFAASCYLKMPPVDALIVSLVLSCKGIVDLANYSILRESEIIEDNFFITSVVYTTICATVVSILLKYLYDPSRKYVGYQKRNVTNTSKNSEVLHLLTCIYRPDNISTVINWLNACYPTREDPINVSVLHLLELIGQVSPVFISHKDKETRACRSYSENVILSFNQYEKHNQGTATVNIFTAVSPPELMYEDICSLALDKQTAFILLPFHQKWGVDRSITPEENNTRLINCEVLEKASCSVGIIIDRDYVRHQQPSSSTSSSMFNACLIFIGGKDDREALILSKRMAVDPNVNLTVLHLKSNNYNNEASHELSWDAILDAEELKVCKYTNVEDQRVKYVEHHVNDGFETASFVTGFVAGYDLIIVGRRKGLASPQTSGLSEICEFPELGALGDLLASKDLNLSALVLVVQQ